MAELSAKEQRYRAMRHVSIVGAVVNLLLALAKLLFGAIAQSQALIADGIHSLSDLATDAMVVFAARRANQEADEEHPYGHGRIETAFTVALGLFLILVAAGLLLDAGHRLINPNSLLHPGPLALLVALVSIVANELLYHYTIYIAERVKSSLLRANAWHHRSDAISSIVVLLGVGGALLGFDYLDAFAAAGVALMIAKIGWDLGWQALQELIDTGLAPERLDAIRESIADVEGVKDFHMLRTRRIGGEAFVDVHVQVSPWLSVSEGHQISEYVRARLTEKIDEVADVTVHIDVENDQDSALSSALPLRREVVAELRACWSPLLPHWPPRQLTLHYLRGKIYVDLVLSPEADTTAAEWRELARLLQLKAKEIEQIGDVQVFFA